MDRSKLKQTVHFICAVAEGLPLGMTRLYKILWFVEKESFLSTLAPILELDFVKGPHGPMPPDAREICAELHAEGKICMATLPKGRYVYVDLKSLAEPDVNLLSEDEKRTIREITLEICTEYTARSISDLTHNSIYEMLSMGEVYPLHLALVEKTKKLSSSELAAFASETEELEAQWFTSRH